LERNLYCTHRASLVLVRTTASSPNEGKGEEEKEVKEMGKRQKDKCSAVAEIGNRLATVDMGRKVGGCCAPFRGG